MDGPGKHDQSNSYVVFLRVPDLFLDHEVESMSEYLYL